MKPNTQADLSLEFCGIKFINPFILASAPPTCNEEMIRRAFDAGWGGAVTKTLIRNAEVITNVTPRITGLSLPGKSRKIFAYENIELVTDRSLFIWLKEIESLRKSYPNHVVIASIMDDARHPEGWGDLARQCESAGAQMIEINMSCPHGMPEMGMGAAIGQNPELASLVTGWTSQSVQIPVMAKMTPNVTDIALIAQHCVQAGSEAIAAINTVAGIIGVDIESFEPMPSVWGYSTPGGISGPAVKPIALRAVAAIAQAVQAPISGIGGISTWEDAAEFILLGATTVQVCSEVMSSGFGIIQGLTNGLSEYLARKGLSRLDELVGLALPKLTSHENLDRRRRMFSHIDYELCIKCGRCQVSCSDAGYQAIIIEENRIPKVIAERCTGCGLCAQVCPIRNCVTLS